MKICLVLIRNFFIQSFRKKSVWILTFALPAVSFTAMFLLIRLNAENTGDAFYAIGTIFFVIMLQAAYISGLTIKDKSQGILARILAAPLRYSYYSISNAVAGFMMLVLQILFTILVVSLVFPSIAVILWKTVPLFLWFGLTAVGLAIFLVGLAETTIQANLIVNFVVIFTCLMGGVCFPIDFMSPFMQKISYIFPQRWAMEGIMKLQAGGSYLDIWLDLVILGLSAVLFMTVHGVVRRNRPV